MLLKVIAFNLICFIFCIISLLLFCLLTLNNYRSSNYPNNYSCRSFSLLKKIAISFQKEREIAVAIAFAIVGRVLTTWEAIQKEAIIQCKKDTK